MSALKRLGIITACILMLVVTGFIVYYVVNQTGLFDNEIITSEPIVMVDVDGRISTKSTWEWKPSESRAKIIYTSNHNTPTQQVSLIFNDEEYYPINIPITPYISDSGKTIWAEDGSYMIRVIGGVTVDTLSAVSGIDNGESINQYTIVTKAGAKGARTIASLFGDTAVIVNVYFGDDNFSILYDSLLNRNTVKFSDIKFSENCNYISELNYTGEYVQSFVIDKTGYQYQSQQFAEGFIGVQTVTKLFEDASYIYLNKLCALSDTKEVNTYYESDGVVYAESGNYSLGIVEQNRNTAVILIGSGEEARCNIIELTYNLTH